MTIAGIVMWLGGAALFAGLGWIVFNRVKTARIAAFAEELVPPSGRFVEAAGKRFHVEERGTGPAILFVHGLGGNLHNFDIPLWPHMGDGYRLIAHDRAGSGYSQPGSGRQGLISEHAGDIVALLDALGIERAVLAGHSLGGAISLATALLHPDRVAGLALLAPLTRHPDRVAPEFAGLDIANPLLRRFAANTFAIPAAIRATDETLAFVFGPQSPPDDYAVGGAAMIGVLPSHFFATSTDLVAMPREMPVFEQRWEEIRVPAGILFGTEDRVLDYRANGEAMAGRVSGLELELLEGIGHMPQYAEPEKTAAFVRRIAERAFASAHSA